MKFNNIYENEIKVDDIPIKVLRPNIGVAPYPTIVFYHGWSSNAEKQKFRAYILACLGYQVLVPTSIYHGERNPIDYSISGNAERYFWRVILKNIEESYKIFDYAVSSLNADKNRIAVMGHSMGGFTAAGIFAQNKSIRTAVVLNGSCDYGFSNKSFPETFNISMNLFPMELIKEIEKYDPMNNLDKIINRPLLMLHGDGDSLIDVNGQRNFFAKVSAIYKDKDKIKYIEYPKLNHLVSTNMMEDIAIWCEEFL